MGKQLRVSLSVIGVVTIVFCLLLFLRLRQHDLYPPTMNVGRDLRTIGHDSPSRPAPSQPRIVRQQDWSSIGSPLDNPAEKPERSHADKHIGQPSNQESPENGADNRLLDPHQVLPEPLVNPRP